MFDQLHEDKGNSGHSGRAEHCVASSVGTLDGQDYGQL